MWVCRLSHVLRNSLPSACPHIDCGGRCTRDNQPCSAIEYAEVKRGVWVLVPNSGDPTMFRCTACEHQEAGGWDNYCPNCGAYMEDA